MARRNYLPPDALHLREASLLKPHHSSSLIDDRRPQHRGPISPPRPPSALIEDRLVSQRREIQSLLVDNQRLAAAHVELKRDLAAAKQELHHLSSTAAAVKAERDAQVREVYERSLKLEAEARSIDGFDSELFQVKADIKNLVSERKDLTAKLQALEDDLRKSRGELKQLPAVEAEIKIMHHEIQRGRAAVEYEKKVHASNFEQGQVMERNMISMAREIDKLRAELANAEKRARATAAAAPVYGNPEVNYRGNSYPEAYALHQLQGVMGGGPSYGPGMLPQGHYDMQWNQGHR